MNNVVTPLGRRGRGSARRWSSIALVSAGVVGLGLVSVPPASAATPSLRVLDASVTETDANRSTCVKVQLSQVPRRRTTVDFTTLNGTAKAPGDYGAKSGTLVFAAGSSRTKSVCVTVKGDLLDEATETFKLRIRNAYRARIADATGVVRIADNDPVPTVAVADAHRMEGSSGATAMTFPVSLSAPSGRQVSMSYAIAPGSPPATSGSDYTVTPESGTLVFPAGVQTKDLTVQVLGDSADETDERVNVTLISPVNATIADGTGVGTIQDDDGPNISIGNVTKAEGWQPGNPFTFNVSLSAPSPQTVSVNYSTANGSAAAGSDFGASSGTLWFSPGQTSRTVTVPVNGDFSVESNEWFVVNLSSPGNGRIIDSQGVGTILNDDASSFDEGMGGALNLGSMSGDTGAGSFTRSDSILIGDADWYRVTLTENDSSLFYARDLTARVRLAVGDSPSQGAGNIDMAIYRSNGSYVGSSAYGGTLDEVFDVKKKDVDWQWDQATFYVRVYGPTSVMNNYTLSVNGNVPTGIAPNL